MATVTAFIRTTKAEKNKFVNVRFRLRDGRQFQLFHKSNLVVLPERWDEKQQKIKSKVLINEHDRKEFNSAISIRKDIIHSIYLREGKTLTSVQLDTEIDKVLNPEKYKTDFDIKTLFQWIRYFIETASNRKDRETGRPLKRGSIQKYYATEKHLKAFAKSIKKDDFNFSEIDSNFNDDFISYLQALNFTQNTIGKHIRVMKTMLNEATIHNVNTNNLYRQFKVFTEEIDNIYLNEHELQLLKDVDLSKISYLDKVRDSFLLLAWTGCRFSDLNKIAKTDIKDNFITFRQQKTNNKVTIPLHPIVLDIMKKYNYDLPAEISNQKFNEYIKSVCRIAKINSPETMTRTEGGKLVTINFEKWEHVTSHTGRRSFCTNMYKQGLPTIMIMSISGHKTEKSFLKYIKIKQEEHAEMMKKAWEKMYNNN